MLTKTVRACLPLVMSGSRRISSFTVPSKFITSLQRKQATSPILNGVGAIVFTILSAFATFERERIAARIREVKQLKKSQGKFTGGRRAFGYDVVDGVKVPREDEQVVIKEMIKMREKGSG